MDTGSSNLNVASSHCASCDVTPKLEVAKLPAIGNFTISYGTFVSTLSVFATQPLASTPTLSVSVTPPGQVKFTCILSTQFDGSFFFRAVILQLDSIDGAQNDLSNLASFH